MDFPLINRDLFFPLRVAHGLFNFTVMLLFFYTARYGLQIRRARRQGGARPIPAIKRHRKLGPILAGLAPIGFFAGLILVFLDTGNILQYPAHLVVGAILVGLIGTTFLVSRKIRGVAASPLRLAHFLLGITILTLYLVQVYLGLGAML